jgi:hypothetical protein
MSNFNVLARLAPLGSLAPARRPHPPRLRFFCARDFAIASQSLTFDILLFFAFT